jgi:hypothetical protein
MQQIPMPGVSVSAFIATVAMKFAILIYAPSLPKKGLSTLKLSKWMLTKKIQLDFWIASLIPKTQFHPNSVALNK